MSKLDTGGMATKHTPAIIDTFRTKTVNVASADFVWDATEWNAGVTAPADGKFTVTAFKIKVSKACFLKVQHAFNTVASLHYFQQGENNDVLIKVCSDATNVDEDSTAFTGATTGTIKAGINY